MQFEIIFNRFYHDFILIESVLKSYRPLLLSFLNTAIGIGTGGRGSAPTPNNFPTYHLPPPPPPTPTPSENNPPTFAFNFYVKQ